MIHGIFRKFHIQENLSLMPTATDPQPANSLTMHSRLFTMTQNPTIILKTHTKKSSRHTKKRFLSFPILAIVQSVLTVLKLDSTVQDIALHCTELNCTVLHWTILYCTALHGTALSCTTLHLTALHCTALHCTALLCPALQCAALHCTALRCTAWDILSHICW